MDMNKQMTVSDNPLLHRFPADAIWKFDKAVNKKININEPKHPARTVPTLVSINWFYKKNYETKIFHKLKKLLLTALTTTG